MAICNRTECKVRDEKFTVLCWNKGMADVKKLEKTLSGSGYRWAYRCDGQIVLLFVDGTLRKKIKDDLKVYDITYMENFGCRVSAIEHIADVYDYNTTYKSNFDIWEILDECENQR